MKIVFGIILSLLMTISFAGNNYWMHALNSMSIPVTLTVFNNYCIYPVDPMQATIPVGKVFTFKVRTNDSGNCNETNGLKSTVGFYANRNPANQITYALGQNWYAGGVIDSLSGNFQGITSEPHQVCNAQADLCFVLKN